jgi:DNA invertase Pin-like site-specific DNA recombinase
MTAEPRRHDISDRQGIGLLWVERTCRPLSGPASNTELVALRVSEHHPPGPVLPAPVVLHYRAQVNRALDLLVSLGRGRPQIKMDAVLRRLPLFDLYGFPRTQAEAKVQVNGRVSRITDSREGSSAFGTSGGVMRALLLARKSNKVQISADKRGEGLSLETQDEVARLFAEAQGWTVIGAAGDTVSGRKVKPTARKNLGPWLTDPALVTRWDVLVAAKGDRISRERIEYWSELEAWAVAHGKTLVVVERGGVFFPPRHEGDSYNWTGIKSMAGAEWDVIRGRVVQSHCRIMRDGYWVGRAPFGYAITGDRYRKTLVPAGTADYVPAVYARAIEGESLQKVADWLTAEGVPTETGNAVWHPGTVKQILSNATYSGTHTRSCVECGGSHDITVPALVDIATQRRAADALRSRVRGSNNGGRPSSSPAMLVPICDACGVPASMAEREVARARHRPREVARLVRCGGLLRSARYRQADESPHALPRIDARAEAGHGLVALPGHGARSRQVARCLRRSRCGQVRRLARCRAGDLPNGHRRFRVHRGPVEDHRR